MTQSTYSWMGSPLHLVFEDDIANAYNRAQDAFKEAQREYKARTGSEWTGHEPILMNWTPEEQSAWNNVAALVNLLIEINGGSLDIKEEDCTSDYLVKVE